ncbi:hypothetical protein K450DRAFT_223287 [Umbelopsis ramanniana AG]|uniref:Uncharacterized protein n=1 Tax=Umbelopsis ramanniana AG TaxID=1314678 RepID=A0AAD5HIK2_UMBRA|nr:uncharacterized protein K450DRAFT_223287 [Umbelopsis ramanniana AG]KAI8583368.1 hypothetical protein K450DRAFT_223287 [Umbelopsis ramanniana AG]
MLCWMVLPAPGTCKVLSFSKRFFVNFHIGYQLLGYTAPLLDTMHLIIDLYTCIDEVWINELLNLSPMNLGTWYNACDISVTRFTG